MNRVCDGCGQENLLTSLHCRACGARLGAKLSDSGKKRRTGHGAGGWILCLLLLSGLGYAGYRYFLMPPASPAAAPALAADSLSGMLQVALAPLDSSNPRAENLRGQITELEHRLGQSSDREVARLGGEFCRQLRAAVAMRRQHESALADIQSRDPTGLDRHAQTDDRKQFLLNTHLANWDNYTAGVRPQLNSLLANLRRAEQSALQ